MRPGSGQVRRDQSNPVVLQTSTEPEPPFDALAVPPKLVAALVTDKQLRAMLKRYGLASDGKKADLLERYNRFRLAVETANDREERTSYERLAFRLAGQEKRKAAASLLSSRTTSTPSGTIIECGGFGGGAGIHGSVRQHIRIESVPPGPEGATTGEGLTLTGWSFKELIAVCRARDRARKAARTLNPNNPKTVASTVPIATDEDRGIRMVEISRRSTGGASGPDHQPNNNVHVGSDGQNADTDAHKESIRKESTPCGEEWTETSSVEVEAPMADVAARVRSVPSKSTIMEAPLHQLCDEHGHDEQQQGQEQEHPNSQHALDCELTKTAPSTTTRAGCRGSHVGPTCRSKEEIVAAEVQAARDMVLGDSEDDVW